MKTIWLLLFAAFANSLPAQTETRDSLGPNEDIYTGYYASGKLRYQRHYSGSVYFWMGEGNASIVGYYKKNGTFIETKKIVHPYERRISMIEYYESGGIKSRTKYFTDTNMVEKVSDSTWYENGRLKSASEWNNKVYLVKNDQGQKSIRLSAFNNEYYENGNCSSKMVLKNWNKTDSAYYENGKIKSVTHTLRNNDFTKTEYREDGTISKTSSGVKGEIITIEYDAEGKPVIAPK
jgi:nicotinamide mononucleotide adenylyltransferase